MASLQSPYIPLQPISNRVANGISHSTPKVDRPAVKAAWVAWVADYKAFLKGGPDPGKFDDPGFTYSDE